MDPVATPLLLGLLGGLAGELITETCRDYLKDQLKSLFFGKLEELDDQNRLQQAYQDAMELALGQSVETLLQSIKAFGYSDQELKAFQPSIEAFIKDRELADELLAAIRHPGDKSHPNPELLNSRWQAIGGDELPSEMTWHQVVSAFQRKASQQAMMSDELREVLNAQNLEQIKALLERQGGVKTQVHLDRYYRRMRKRYAPVDLANLMPSYANDPGRLVIKDVFVAPNVRENPPPEEIPKDLIKLLEEKEGAKGEPDVQEEQRLEKLHRHHVNQSPQPVLQVIANSRHRLMVLTGGPGSGKSTLMRYLLTGVMEPPTDRNTGEPLPWTVPFQNAFPLLIDLRDFYALRVAGECDSFLEYVAYMGKTDHWALDDHAVNEYLMNGPSLVMFDGLDEIFDGADRQRVMHEIAGFSQYYPLAKVVVTSRPVGYKDQILRDAGFDHFGIQDLDDEQVEQFVRGWFALTFPQAAKQAEHRTERVLSSIKQSSSIRLLAGNPMLLTIMALLAREEELPRERAKFYEKSVEVLCHHWDANKFLKDSDHRALDVEDKKALLRRIAIRMQQGNGGLKGNMIPEAELEKEIQAYLLDAQLQSDVAEAKYAARQMIKQLQSRNYILCPRGPGLYGFIHRTFLEYLIASQYERDFNRQPQKINFEELKQLFIDHCGDDEWREVLRLICGQIDEIYVGRIIRCLLSKTNLNKWDGKEGVKEFPLTVWCLSDARNIRSLKAASSQLLESLYRVITKNSLGREWDDEADYYAHGDLYDFLHGELLPAIKYNSGKWPQINKIREAALIDIHSINTAAMKIWAPFLLSIFEDRDLAYQLAESERFLVRYGAIESIAEIWPDDESKDFLMSRAVSDINGYPRSAAIRALAKSWPDTKTQDFLVTRCKKENKFWVRRVLFETLAEFFKNDLTRRELEHYALHEEDPDPRLKALKCLSQNWLDNDCIKLLSKQSMVDGAAASVLGGLHSEFGEVLFIDDMYEFEFVNPREPVPYKKITKVARSVGIPESEIEINLQALSSHMGWDITKGSAAKLAEEAALPQDG